MGVRMKLNKSYFNGSVLAAGVAGWLTGSWLDFMVALAILLAANVYAGEIRMKKRNG